MHTIGYMCKSTLCHSRTLISAIPATHTNICDFLDKCISTFQLRFKLLLCHLIFPHCINSLQRLQHNNKYLHFYCIIMLIRRSFNSPLAACNVRGTQKGSCEALQRADWSLSPCVCALHFSEKCVLFSSESGYLSCSFDDGLCGWISDKDGDLHWETTPDPSGSWSAGVNCFHSHTLIRKTVYFIACQWK